MAMASNGSDYHGKLKKNVGLQYVFSFHQAPTFGGGNKLYKICWLHNLRWLITKTYYRSSCGRDESCTKLAGGTT